MSAAINAGALKAPAALPASVDLRETWWDIGNQELTGSCVGWATGDGVMRYLLVQAGKIAQTQKVSPRYVWMASKETDEFTTRPGSFIEEAGTSLKAACEICTKYGVALEDELPFSISTAMYLGDEDTFYATTAMRRAALYTNITSLGSNWKMALASGKPILAGLTVDSNWMNLGPSGLLDTFLADRTGGHAVCIVGYRSDGRFIIRNSWDTTWGDKGFAYASPAYIQQAFFNEAYTMVI